MNKFEYHGFKIMVREGAPVPVSVYNLNYPKNQALYRTTSIDLAAKWIDAYRAGEHWAVEARILGGTP